MKLDRWLRWREGLAFAILGTVWVLGISILVIVSEPLLAPGLMLWGGYGLVDLWGSWASWSGKRWNQFRRMRWPTFALAVALLWTGGWLSSKQ